MLIVTGVADNAIENINLHGSARPGMENINSPRSWRRLTLIMCVSHSLNECTQAAQMAFQDRLILAFLHENR